MPATLQQLTSVSSQWMEALRAYLKALEADLGTNPLLNRFGRSLDDLRVPLRVVPHEPVRDLDAIRARQHFRSMGLDAEDGDADSAARRIYRFRGGTFDDEREARAGPERLDEIEAQLAMAVLLGDPGSGKTEWLKYRARRAAREMREQIERRTVLLEALCFPAYLRLPDLATVLHKDRDLVTLLVQTGCVTSHPAVLRDAERVAAAMLHTLLEHHHLHRRLAPWVWNRLTMTRQTSVGPPLLLCLDAWDEVRSGQAELARVLQAFSRETAARLLLTSRLIGYDQRLLPEATTPDGPQRELQLCPFTWDEAATFVRHFFRGDPARGQQMLDELRHKMAVGGMAQNPLLATLLCLAFSPQPDREPLRFPARRVEVYERVLAGLLGEWEALDKGEPPDADLIQAKLGLLEEMACHFFPDEVLGSDRVHQFLWRPKRGYMRRLDDVDPLKQWLRETKTTVPKALCQDGVLLPCGGANALQFLHMTFQESLTACALARRANDEGWHTIVDLVHHNAWLPAWHEVLILLAGKLANPLPLLALLNEVKKDDYFRHRLALAAVCLAEIPEAARVQQAVADQVNQITTDAFTLWWAHRCNGTIAVVPYLTRALSALRQVNGHVLGDVRRSTLSAGDDLSLLDWLIRHLTAVWVDVRRAAAKAIGELGPAAATEAILTALVGLLHDKDRTVRSAAAEAIGRLCSARLRMFRTPEGTWVARSILELAAS
jgi:HEAT repeats